MVCVIIFNVRLDGDLHFLYLAMSATARGCIIHIISITTIIFLSTIAKIYDMLRCSGILRMCLEERRIK